MTSPAFPTYVVSQSDQPVGIASKPLLDAAGKLSDYLHTRPLPFYPWLRSLALERLLMIYRKHLHAGKRSGRPRQHRLPRSDGGC